LCGGPTAGHLRRHRAADGPFLTDPLGSASSPRAVAAGGPATAVPTGNFSPRGWAEHVTERCLCALDAGRINQKPYLFFLDERLRYTSSARILARSRTVNHVPYVDALWVCDSCQGLAPNAPGSIDLVNSTQQPRRRRRHPELLDRAFLCAGAVALPGVQFVTRRTWSPRRVQSLLKIVGERPKALFSSSPHRTGEGLPTIRSRTITTRSGCCRRAHAGVIGGSVRQEAVVVDDAYSAASVPAGSPRDLSRC